MSVEKDIRYELLARLCPNSTGTEHYADGFVILNLVVAVVFLTI